MSIMDFAKERVDCPTCKEMNVLTGWDALTCDMLPDNYAFKCRVCGCGFRVRRVLQTEVAELAEEIGSESSCPSRP